MATNRLSSKPIGPRVEYHKWNKGAKPKRQNMAKARKGKRQSRKPKATSREAIRQRVELKGRSQKEKFQR